VEDHNAHGETIHTAREITEVGWYQPEPKLSLESIEMVAPPRARIIDVGGGASVLVDRLLVALARNPATNCREARF